MENLYEFVKPNRKLLNGQVLTIGYLQVGGHHVSLSGDFYG